MVDLNRQSLDRVVPDIQIRRLQGMFAAAGWQVLTLKWGRRISEIFDRPGGDVLRDPTGEDAQRGVPAAAAAPQPRSSDRLLGVAGPGPGRRLVDR